jgi:hypothetical protein
MITDKQKTKTIPKGKNTPKRSIKNKIKSILADRGFQDFKPTDELLASLGGIGRISFFKMLDNKIQPSFEESFLIAEWLNVSVNDLYLIIE